MDNVTDEEIEQLLAEIPSDNESETDPEPDSEDDSVITPRSSALRKLTPKSSSTGKTRCTPISSGNKRRSIKTYSPNRPCADPSLVPSRRGARIRVPRKPFTFSEPTKSDSPLDIEMLCVPLDNITEFNVAESNAEECTTAEFLEPVAGPSTAAEVFEPIAGPSTAAEFLEPIAEPAPGLDDSFILDVFLPEEIPQIDDDNEAQYTAEEDVPLSVRLAGPWRDNPEPPVVKEFSEPVGFTWPHLIETPTDYFNIVWPDLLIQTIVFQTNLYATQRGKPFLPVTDTEIKQFLAINLLMGIKKLPSYRDYWSAHLELRDHFIASLMPQKRFSWILGNLHLNDNTLAPKKGEDGFNKLYKLQPMLDILTTSFLHAMNPSREQSIDESMIRFKGKSSLKQYMPKKPTKRGYKVWVRADSSGYCCEFQIYTGKADSPEKNLGKRVVQDLTRRLAGKNHIAYFDNYFAGYELVKELLTDKIYACGTIMKKRKHLPQLPGYENDERGEYVWKADTNGISFMRWKDAKDVHLISSVHDPRMRTSVSRKQKDGTAQNIPCPMAVKDYNKHMGYVDRMDHLKTLYEIDRQSNKWWHRIFFYFLDIAVVNSYVMFKSQSEGSSLTMKSFRMAVASGLSGVSTPAARGRRATPQPVSKFKPIIPLETRYTSNAHLPKIGTFRRCAHCSTKKEAHRSHWACSTCKVALCLAPTRNCFAPYHRKNGNDSDGGEDGDGVVVD